MILLALAMQAAGIPAADMKSSMKQVSAAEAAELFKRVCYAPFPDPKASLAVIADPALGLTKLPETPSQAMQPGDAWTSPTARVTYVDADWLPRDFGSPQCGITVALADAPDHLAVETAFITAMALPPGKGGKNKATGQTQWDMPRAPDSWRLFVSTSTTPSGKELRATIMNLRGKKPK